MFKELNKSGTSIVISHRPITGVQYRVVNPDNLANWDYMNRLKRHCYLQRKIMADNIGQY